MALSFNRTNICSGVETITVGQTSPRTVIFEKEMEGNPTVTVTPIETNQNVIAVNVTSSGFDIILSLDGIGEPGETFKVHYQAIFIR